MKPTEKTKLLKRLKGFCNMLGDDLNKLNADLVARLETTIHRLEDSPKVVVAGNSESQHRRLAEFLLGVDLFRENDTQNYPTIRIRYGREHRTHAVLNGKRESYQGSGISQLLSGKAPQAIGIELPNAVAAKVEFAVLPDYDGEEDRVRYLVDMIENTGAIVWCSDAGSRWQPSERRIWFTVPDELKNRSILALTGAERLTDDAANDLLEEKRSLVVDEFHAITPIDIPTARAATRAGNVLDPDGFSRSGGQDILSSLLDLVVVEQEALIEEARKLRAEIDEIPLGEVVDATPMPPLPAARQDDDSLEGKLVAALNRCSEASTGLSGSDFAPVFEAMNDALSDLGKSLPDHVDDSELRDQVSSELAEATELLALLAYENNASAAGEAADIVCQIASEIWQLAVRKASGDTPNLTDFPQVSVAG